MKFIKNAYLVNTFTQKTTTQIQYIAVAGMDVITSLMRRKQGTMMDIKARIDGLSETEAKAALEWVLNRIENLPVICFSTNEPVCPLNKKCGKLIEHHCMQTWLDEAIKEAYKIAGN